jgi:hypothetical protein
LAILGGITVFLEAGPTPPITSVTCHWDDSDKESVACIHKGQIITVDGKGGSGLSLGAVFLKDCQLVKAEVDRGGGAPQESRPAATRPGLPRVGSFALFKGYEDIAACDAVYLNKVIEATGMDSKVRKDSGGQYYIAGNPQGARFRRTNLPPREALAADAYVPAFIALVKDGDQLASAAAKGGPVTIRGKCRGHQHDGRTIPD